MPLRTAIRQITRTFHQQNQRALRRAGLSSSAGKSARIVGARAQNGSPERPSVDVEFADGTAWRFHGMWLRDGCRDASHVQESTERHLHAAPLVAGLWSMGDAAAKDVQPSPCGTQLEVSWHHPSLPRSTFEAAFLRGYADTVAKPLEQTTPAKGAEDWFQFLEDDVGRPQHLQTLWSNDGTFELPRFDHDELVGSPDAHEAYLKALMNPGVAIVENMPQDPNYDGQALSNFAQTFLGGLQKHPLRENAHWTISTDETVFDPSNKMQDVSLRKTANSYNTDVQLANHTDQSLYGTPGLLLGFHCAMGEGNNSLTDGAAVAYALKERYPQHYKALTELGYHAGRRLQYYKAGEFDFLGEFKVLTEDADGNVKRVRFHEIYRTPSQHSYDDFPRFAAAITQFYKMVHSPEFQIHLTLKEGELLMMNNWRTMHGRAGLKGKARTILGGTVTRDAFVSSTRELRRKQLGFLDKNDGLECGMRLSDMGLLGELRASDEAKMAA